MEMSLGHCYDCPVVLSHFILGPVVAALLVGFAFWLARGHLRALSYLAAVLGWCVLSVFVSVAWRAGIDWRWSRLDFEFVWSPNADMTVAGALLFGLLASVYWMVGVWRRPPSGRAS